MEAGRVGGRWQSSSSEKQDLFSEAGRGEESLSSSEDLISELPDSLLHHILSFLDMRCVIRTSFLSTRWRYLWVSLPFLNFKNLSIQCSESLSFVDKVLSHRDTSNKIHTFTVDASNMHTYTFTASNLDTLVFQSDETYKINLTEHFHKWIHVAVLHSVEDFAVDTRTRYLDSGWLTLPHCFFTCNSLTTLKLMGNIKLPLDLLPASSAHLPRLKTLHLTSIELQGGGDIDVTTGNFFSRCPVLETLSISYCYLYKTNMIDIFAPQLKNLEINCLSLKPTPTRHNCDIRVSAPKLTYFRSRDVSLNYYTFVEPSSLSCAYIDTYWFSRCDASKYSYYDHVSYSNLVSEFRKASYPESLMQCLQGIYNVRSLTLCARLLELIEVSVCMRSRIILFRNLKSLTLLKTSLSKDEIYEITYLLEKCPLVETLTLTMSMPRLLKLFNKKKNDSGEKVERGKADLPLSFKLHHLTVVEIWCIIGAHNELEFLEFLLENAPRMEKMDLYITEMKFEEIQSLKKRNKLKRDQKKRLESFRPALETFPSASSTVKVSFFELSSCIYT